MADRGNQPPGARRGSENWDRPNRQPNGSQKDLGKAGTPDSGFNIRLYNHKDRKQCNTQITFGAPYGPKGTQQTPPTNRKRGHTSQDRQMPDYVLKNTNFRTSFMFEPSYFTKLQLNVHIYVYKHIYTYSTEQ